VDDATEEMTARAIERTAEMETFRMMLSCWVWPIAAFEFWTSSIGKMLDDDGPQIDRDDHSAQLPIPNPLQRAMDSDLFA